MLWKFNSPPEANPILKARNGHVRSRTRHELGEKIAFQENQTINLAEEPPYKEKTADTSRKRSLFCSRADFKSAYKERGTEERSLCHQRRCVRGGGRDGGDRSGETSLAEEL